MQNFGIIIFQDIDRNSFYDINEEFFVLGIDVVVMILN